MTQPGHPSHTPATLIPQRTQCDEVPSLSSAPCFICERRYVFFAPAPGSDAAGAGELSRRLPFNLSANTDAASYVGTQTLQRLQKDYDGSADAAKVRGHFLSTDSVPSHGNFSRCTSVT